MKESRSIMMLNINSGKKDGLYFSFSWVILSSLDQRLTNRLSFDGPRAKIFSDS